MRIIATWIVNIAGWGLIVGLVNFQTPKDYLIYISGAVLVSLANVIGTESR